MDRVVKVVGASKKIQNNRDNNQDKYQDNNQGNNQQSLKKDGEILSKEDFTFGYLLGCIKRESDSKLSKEKNNIIGNSWIALMDEMLEEEEEEDRPKTLTNDINSLTSFAAANTSNINSNSPLGSSEMRTPSPVFYLASGGSATMGHKNSFQAKAPSPRPKKMN